MYYDTFKLCCVDSLELMNESALRLVFSFMDREGSDLVSIDTRYHCYREAQYLDVVFKDGFCSMYQAPMFALPRYQQVDYEGFKHEVLTYIKTN